MKWSNPAKITQFSVVLTIFVVLCFVIAFAINTNSSYQRGQWYILNVYFLILCGLTPITFEPKVFFKGGIADNARPSAQCVVVSACV